MARVYPILACLAIFLLLGSVAFLFDRSVVAKGVGGTNLDIDFVVEDEQTKQPVPEARIEVNSEGGFYDGADKEIGKLDLKADAAGMAHREFRGRVVYRFQ
jgi:hypothetical protein